MTPWRTTSASAGALLRHVRTGRARSRAELVALTGASRNTVSARVDQLIAANLLEEGGRGWSTGGRPPTLLQFNSRAGCVLAVDLGVTSVDVAVTDLSAQILATAGHPIDIGEGPGPVLAEVDRLARQVLAEAGLTPADVCAVGVGVPGPVEFSTGRPSHPPIMPGWHDYPIPSAFGRYECPVYVDNDVNVMALGEMGVAGSAQDVLVVKVGTGIGCGIIVDGRVYRGAQGSAGDIGHIYVAQPDGRTVLCRCGNANCLEAIAGGGALLRDAVAAGLPVDDDARGRRARRARGRRRAGAGAQRRPDHRHGARLAGQLLQPAPDRHDRWRGPGRRPAARRHPRGGLRPLAAAGRPLPGDHGQRRAGPLRPGGRRAHGHRGIPRRGLGRQR